MAPPAARTILHVDLDAFYAAVEQRDNPALRGKPVLVGGSRRRGVVCAASYEARPFGVRSAMAMAQAIKLCPHAIVLPTRMAHYGQVSSRFFSILHRYSPLIEGLSLDEAFLDVTGEERLFGDGRSIAWAIKQQVRAELGLIVSVGVAPSKFVAKVASDVGKPDGLLVIEPSEVLRFLHPLPSQRLWGVGKVTEAELAALGLRTIGDVARTSEKVLAARVGATHARHLWNLANAIDDREVTPDRAPVSIGHEVTFESDLHNRDALVSHLLDQGDRACARMRAHGLCARNITLKIKYADHKRTSRRLTLPEPTVDGRKVGEQLRQLLLQVPDIETRGVRLTGVSLSGLHPRHAERQLSLPTGETAGSPRERGVELGHALDEIAARFGERTIRRAVCLESDERDG